MLVNQAGETVASVGWDHIEGEVAMFGGFVSAVQMFVKRIAGGNKVEEVKFGAMRLLIGSSDQFHVITLHDANGKDATTENQKVVNLIRDANGGISDGMLELISELVSRDEAKATGVSESVKEWTESQLEKSKKAALDWGKTVL